MLSSGNGLLAFLQQNLFIQCLLQAEMIFRFWIKSHFLPLSRIGIIQDRAKIHLSLMRLFSVGSL